MVEPAALSQPANVPLSKNSVAQPTRRRHEKYYIEDRLSTFLVSGSLFRVHRYYLVLESPVFKDMFACSSGEVPMEGESDDKPIELPGTTVDEFEALLDFLYNRLYDDYSSFNLTRWKNLLTVSDRYQFDKVRQRAIAEITKLKSELNGVDQLLLAVKCSVTQWIVPALVKLLVRPKILEPGEAERLPLSIVLRLWNAREVYHRTPIGAPMQSMFGGSPLPSVSTISEAERIAERIVRDEFRGCGYQGLD